jgi:hypothetical protein
VRWREVLLPWLPVALLIAIVGVYLIAYNVLTICAAKSSPCIPESALRPALDTLLAKWSEPDSSTRFLALSGRIKWATGVGLSMLFTMIAVGVALLAIYSVSRLHLPSATIPLMTVSFLFFSLLVFLALRPTWAIDVHPWRQMLNGRLLADVPQVATWNPRLDSIGLLAALYLAFAATIVTRVALVQTRFSESHEACAFWLRAILYSGAALLVATVFRSHALFEWSLSYLPELSGDGDIDLVRVRSAAGVLGGTITAVEGAFFSAMLAALYIPSALLVHSSGDRLLSATGESLESNRRKQWETQIPLTKIVPRMVAILSPLATGWLATALSALQQ